MIFKVLLINFIFCVLVNRTFSQNYTLQSIQINDSIISIKRIKYAPLGGVTMIYQKDRKKDSTSETSYCINASYNIFRKDIYSLKPCNIRKFEYVDTATINKIGFVKIYKSEIINSKENELPYMAFGKFFLFIKNEPKYVQVYCLFLDEIKFIKVSTNNVIYIGGYFNQNDYGYFYIYTLKDNLLVSIFNTDSYTYNYSGECESFKSGYLKFQNIDLNGDGILDLHFSGIKNYYCTGGEDGPSRLNRKPLYSKKVVLNYIFTCKDGIPTWINYKKKK